MKIYNPTKQTINSITRVDGKWFDGIHPGETLEVEDNKAIRVLLKHGCVKAEDKRKVNARIAAEEKKIKAAEDKAEEEAKEKAEAKAKESEYNRPGGVNKFGFGPSNPEDKPAEDTPEEDKEADKEAVAEDG